MDLRQLPTADNVPIQLQGQQQQPVFLPLSNPVLSNSTAHVMPTPTSNWSMESMPWKITKTDQSGNVVEFTGRGANSKYDERRALLHQKRKSQFIAIGTLPVKQFISEEKITAHFNGLHISSDYIQHKSSNITDNSDDELPSTSGKCFSNLTYEDYQITAKELEEKLRNANRITVCEELKKFNDEQNKVSYLPEALLHRINKPCTALVLWQPSPIRNICSQKNVNNNENKNKTNKEQQIEAIDDDTIPDIDLPPVLQENIDDFIDNNNTCSLDFNNIKPDSMDEDL